LQGYDYLNRGAYLIMICTHKRQHIFGSINNGNMALRAMGPMATVGGDTVPAHFPSVE
jgi:hypothetical protein